MLFVANAWIAPASAENRIDSPMYNQPELPAPEIVLVFSDKAKELWLKALARPEADMRRQAAQTIARAHRRGMKGLESAVAPLGAVLTRTDEHPAVRLEAARAIIELGARETGQTLFLVAQSGSSELRELIEPALAQWDYGPARHMWLKRLYDRESSLRKLTLAITSLAAVRDSRAAEEFRKLVVSDRTPASIRLETARALAVLRGNGLEKDAEHLASDDSVRGLGARLAAALLLGQHKSEEAVRLLQRLARDREPAIAGVAVARLVQIDPRFVLGQVDRLLASRDKKLREHAVDTLRRIHEEKHVPLLGARLSDPHPDVRIAARRALHELAMQHGLQSQVIAEGMKRLNAGDWRGQEQAAILLSDLDHKPAGRRLVQLLGAERSEVFVTAAWALRRLAVADTLPDVVRYLESELPLFKERQNRAKTSPFLVDHHLSQLNQLLGQQKFRPADAILRGFVPRMTNVYSFESRAAALWALGLLHEGKRDAELEKLALARLTDTSSMPPEDLRVRRMAGILLGRVGAKDALPILRKFTIKFEMTGSPINDACNWSIARLTGTKLPAMKPVEKTPKDWFLTPR